MSARSLNKVMIIGNLTRDPNLRYTPGGAAVCSFGLATNRTWTPTDGGEKQEKVEYHNIVAWSKLADICGQLLHKGDKVYVEGRLQSREWKAEDGAERRITEIVIENMILLKSTTGASGSYSADDAEDDESFTSPAKPATKKKKVQKEEDDVIAPTSEEVADDIPF